MIEHSLARGLIVVVGFGIGAIAPFADAAGFGPEKHRSAESASMLSEQKIQEAREGDTAPQPGPAQPDDATRGVLLHPLIRAYAL